MKSPSTFLSLQQKIDTAKTIPGVIDFKKSRKNDFHLITVEPQTDYHTLVKKLDEENIEQQHLFICEEDPNELTGKRYSAYIRKTRSFQRVDLYIVSLYFRWILTESLTKRVRNILVSNI